jgi:hypothetical protein
MAQAERTLVDDKLSETMGAGVHVGFGDDPGGRVRDAEVQHLAAEDDAIEGLHDLLDGRDVVEPMQVKDVDVCRSASKEERRMGDDTSAQLVCSLASDASRES